jgi:amino acid permease
MALLFSSIVSFVLVLLMVQTKTPKVHSVILDLSKLSALFTYVFLDVTYVMIKLRYAHIERVYQSPVGILGAIFSLLVYLVCLLCLLIKDTETIGLALIF